MAEILTVDCPFCKEETIKLMHRPEVYSTQTIRVGGNVKTIPKLTPPKDEILSKNCSNCGKSKKEIQKALKEDVPQSREEIIRRAKEQDFL